MFLHGRGRYPYKIIKAAGNFFDHDIDEVDPWPFWKRNLMHEMLHQYQFKVIKVIGKILDGAKSLFDKNRPWLDSLGNDHDEAFCAAIIEKAPYFEFTPDELILHIWRARELLASSKIDQDIRDDRSMRDPLAMLARMAQLEREN